MADGLKEDFSEVRKLVKTGADTYTVSLPKRWINNNKLNKGDSLFLAEKKESIEIFTSPEQKKIVKEISIKIDERDISTIRRETIASYINNYNTISFEGKELNKKLEDVRKILDNFLALEVIDHTDNKLVVKDHLNIKEFDLKNTLRRMDMLTRSILTDSRKGKEQYEALYFRDFEVDKLFFLISRLTRAILNNEMSSEFKSVEVLNMWWFAKNIERISDSARELSKGFNGDVLKIFNEIDDYYRECVGTYFTKDKEKADELIAKRLKLLEKIDKSEQKIYLKDLIDDSRNIAKIVLDS